MDEEISVGVGRGQVAVVDLLAAELHASRHRERSSSVARLWAEGAVGL